MIKAVIFDMDGLMFDTERLTADAWVYVGEQIGKPITFEMAKSVIGIRDADTKGIFTHILGADLDYESARIMRVQRVFECIDKYGMPVKDGLYELLDALDAGGYKKAVASSTERTRVMRCLESAGIADRFDAIICGDMVKKGKPDPEIFITAADLVGEPPKNCLVLEDSHYGVKAAHSAHIPVIMIPDLLPRTAETDLMATETMPSLREVIPYINASERT